MLRVGLLGAGRIGGVHAEAISSHPGSTLVAVSDVFKDNAESLAGQYDCAVCSSEDLCEKPVDLSLERASACLSNVGDKAPCIMIGFNRRFDPSFGALKGAIDAGEIGKTELLSITSFDPAPPPVAYIKVSGGLFRDMMIHDFDMANFLMGEAPVMVSAVGASIVDPEIGAAGDVDTAVVTLSYEDGRIAVIKNSRRAVYGYDQRVEVLGADGLLQAQNVLENTVVKSTTSGVVSAKPTYFFLERYMPAYKAEWAAFVDAVRQGSAMPVNLKDGVAALAMAEAATQSVATGQPVALADVLEQSGR